MRHAPADRAHAALADHAAQFDRSECGSSRGLTYRVFETYNGLFQWNDHGRRLVIIRIARENGLKNIVVFPATSSSGTLR